MSGLRFGSWATTECFQCGCDFQVTRIQEKTFEKDEDILCEACEMWNRGYKEGYEKGLAEAMAKLPTNDQALLKLSKIEEILKEKPVQ